MQMPPSRQSSKPVVSPGAPSAHASPMATSPSGTQSVRASSGSAWTTSQVHFLPAAQPCCVYGLHESPFSDASGDAGEASLVATASIDGPLASALLAASPPLPGEASSEPPPPPPHAMRNPAAP